MAHDNADALNRFLDDLSHGAAVPDDELDPDLIATVRWFRDFGAEPRPNPDFRNQLEHDLMNPIALVPAMGMPAADATPLLPSGSERRHISPLAHLPRRLSRLQWASAVLAAAVLLAALGLGYLALESLRPNPDRPHEIPAAIVPEPSATPMPLAATATAIPVSTTDHPLAGAWQWMFASGVSYGVFEPDGTYIEYFPDNGVGLGGWRPTGERSVELVVVYQIPAEPLAREEVFAPDYAAGHAFQPGVLIQRLTIEVDETWTNLTATGTSERRDAVGNVISSTQIEPQRAMRVGGMVPAIPTEGAGVVIIQVVAEDGTTPIAGLCLELTGPVTVSVCDNAEGDADPTPGKLELDDLPAGEYVVDALPPEGYLPSHKPNTLSVHPGQVGTLTIYLRPTDETSGSTATEPPGSTGEAGIVIVQVVDEDGTTPIGGACLELTGPTTVQVCDNGPEDLDPGVGSLELDGLPAGEYTVAVLAPDGYEPTGNPATVAIAPDQVTTVVLTLSQTTGETSGPTPTVASPPMPTSTPVP